MNCILVVCRIARTVDGDDKPEYAHVADLQAVLRIVQPAVHQPLTDLSPRLQRHPILSL